MAEAYTFEKDGNKITKIQPNKQFTADEKRALLTELMAANGPGDETMALFGKALRASKDFKEAPAATVNEAPATPAIEPQPKAMPKAVAPAAKPKETPVIPAAKPKFEPIPIDTDLPMPAKQAEAPKATIEGKDKGYILTHDASGKIIDLKITGNITPAAQQELMNTMLKGGARKLYENVAEGFNYSVGFTPEVVKANIDATRDENGKVSLVGFDFLTNGQPGRTEVAKRYIDEVVRQNGNLDATGAALAGTGMMAAAKDGNIELIDYLAEKGAKVNVLSLHANGTALQSAISWDRTEAALHLLDKHNADPNLNASPNRTTLGEAAVTGNKVVYEKLLEKGFDISKVSKGHLMANAGMGGSVEILKDLVETRHINPNETHITEGAPYSGLGAAVNSMNADAVNYLLSKDAVVTNSVMNIAQHNADASRASAIPGKDPAGILQVLQKHVTEKQKGLTQEVDNSYLKEDKTADQKGASVGISDDVRKQVENSVSGLDIKLAHSAKGALRPAIMNAEAFAKSKTEIGHA